TPGAQAEGREGRARTIFRWKIVSAERTIREDRAGRGPFAIAPVERLQARTPGAQAERRAGRARPIPRGQTVSAERTPRAERAGRGAPGRSSGGRSAAPNARSARIGPEGGRSQSLRWSDCRPERPEHRRRAG